MRQPVQNTVLLLDDLVQVIDQFQPRGMVSLNGFQLVFKLCDLFVLIHHCQDQPAFWAGEQVFLDLFSTVRILRGFGWR